MQWSEMNRPEFRQMTIERLARLAQAKAPTEAERIIEAARTRDTNWEGQPHE